MAALSAGGLQQLVQGVGRHLGDLDHLNGSVVGAVCRGGDPVWIDPRAEREALLRLP